MIKWFYVTNISETLSKPKVFIHLKCIATRENDDFRVIFGPKGFQKVKIDKNWLLL